MIHVYSQPYWHQDSLIQGTADDLQALAEALLETVKNGTGRVTTEAGDGEGYYLNLKCSTEEEMHLARMPYSDDCALETEGAWRQRTQQ